MLTSLKPLIEFIRGLIPDSIKTAVNKAVELIDRALKGEPVLVIGNGAAVVIYLAANALGRIPDLSFEQAMSAASAAIVTLNAAFLAIRSVVYSPATVAKIVITPPADISPVEAEEDET